MVSTRSSAKKKLVEAEAEAEAEVKTVHGGMAKGATICGFSVFLLMTAISVRFPYLQEQRDRLGCDELCTGTMTSARHAFSLVGAALIGRLSDHKGRRPALLVGAAAAFTAMPFHVPLMTGDIDDEIASGGASPRWHHGTISGTAAEQRLQASGLIEGSFLVSENAVINFLIKAKKGVLSMGDKYPTFGSLDSLVKHFSSDKRNGFPTRLTKPCPSPVDAGGGGGGANAGRRKAPLTKSEMEAKKRRRRARRDKAMKEQLANLPQFKPYWTKGTCYLMFVILAIEIWQSWDPEQPFTKVSFKPIVTTGSPPVGLDEDRSESFTKIVPTNFLIGPSAEDLVFYGAKYAPCMRADTRLMASLAQQREAEAETLGCCKLTVLDGVSTGQTTEEGCPAGGYWAEGKCIEGGEGEVIKLRPCCIANNGTCSITTLEFCQFYDGVWDTTKQTCGETNCFMSLGAQVESAAGWLRMMLIYLISGMGGNLFSAVFSPDVPSVGCSGALCGLLGVAIVDLFQSWRVVENPCSKMLKVLFQTVIFFLVGTLPFICIVCLCIPVLIALTFVLFLMFYEIQGTEFCPKCKYIQCIPYTEDFCINTPGWSDN
eukprot:gene13592-24322_t